MRNARSDFAQRFSDLGDYVQSRPAYSPGVFCKRRGRSLHRPMLTPLQRIFKAHAKGRVVSFDYQANVYFGPL